MIFPVAFKLTPWSRILSQKLTDPQLIKKFPHFIDSEGSLLHSQKPNGFNSSGSRQEPVVRLCVLSMKVQASMGQGIS
jgi:hypothetical protein